MALRPETQNVDPTHGSTCSTCQSTDTVVTHYRNGMDGYIYKEWECMDCGAHWIVGDKPAPGVGPRHNREA